MLEKLISSYGVFISLYQILIERFSHTYRFIADELDLAALLLFYAQVVVASMYLTSLLFPDLIEADDNNFDQIWFVVRQAMSFVLAFVVAMVFYISLRVTKLKGRFAEVLKFFITMQVFIGTNTLILSLAFDYYLYSATDFFASMSDLDWHDQVLAQPDIEAIFMFQEIISPILLLCLYAALFYFSIYRRVFVAILGVASIVVVEVSVGRAMSAVWMEYLGVLFPTPLM